MKRKAKFLLFIKSAEGIKVFLGRRTSTDKAEFWWLPGGAVEGNENLFDAALREVNEELYISDRMYQELKAYAGKAEKGLVNYATEKYTGSVMFLELSPELLNELPGIKDEFDEVKWFPVDKLPKNMSRDFEHIKKYVTEEYIGGL